MKSSYFIVFISIVLTVYSLANFYVFYHGYNALKAFSTLKYIFIVVFLFFSLSYIIARIAHPLKHSYINEIFLTTGSFWLAALEYFLILCLLIDIFRVINHFIPFLPSFVYFNFENTKLYLFIFSILVTSGVLSFGFINAKNPVIVDYTLPIDKKIPDKKEINIVMVSDIHLGVLSCGKWFDEAVEKINSLNPDIILLVGDVIDEDVKPVIKQNLGDHLLNLKSKFGVYAVTGNHEYYGGVEPAVKYLQDHNIKVLRDSAVLIDNLFYLIGREDKEKERITGFPRKDLTELLKSVDVNYPVILMNHQPSGLPELEGKGIDISLSGHTHHGQYFPNNFFTSRIYEISRGLEKKYGTWIYVSVGLGTWGPPIRIGNKPEIVKIVVKEKN